MKIEVYIRELLYKYDCVIIPDFGGLILNYKPARIHPVLHTFLPPSKDILFNRNLKNNDGLLANYISSKENISYKNAVSQIEEFVSEINRSLEKSRKINLPDIGTFYIDLDNVIKFKPDEKANYLISSYGFSEFVSPAIQRSDLQKRIEKKFAENRIIRSERKTGSFITRAAIITVPLLALSVWGLLNFSAIKNVYTNYSSLIPFLKNDSEVGINKAIVTDNRIFYSGYYSAFNTEQKFSFIDNNNINVYDSNVIFVNTNINLERPGNFNTEYLKDSDKSIALTNTNNYKFFIIGSCFKSHENAINYKASLKEQGFVNADIIEPESGGLYKVFFDAFSTQEEADASIKNIKQYNSNAWIFKAK